MVRLQTFSLKHLVVHLFTASMSHPDGLDVQAVRALRRKTAVRSGSAGRPSKVEGGESAHKAQQRQNKELPTPPKKWYKD